MNDFLILWFEINGELTATNLSYTDLKKGTKQIQITNGKSSVINYGYRRLEDAKGISRFRFRDDFWTSHLVKWEDQNKLFEKYPELKEIVA